MRFVTHVYEIKISKAPHCCPPAGVVKWKCFSVGDHHHAFLLNVVLSDARLFFHLRTVGRLLCIGHLWRSEVSPMSLYFIHFLEKMENYWRHNLLEIGSHTMDMLWEKFQWILPLYMKPISFQSKASVVCSVTAVVFIDFCLKKLNVFSQHIGQKNKWISEFHRTNPQELKCWSTFYVNYFIRYYLMMQHQPILKRVNGTHEWAHRPYRPLSAPYHCCLYKHRRLDERQPPKISWPLPIST